MKEGDIIQHTGYIHSVFLIVKELPDFKYLLVSCNYGQFVESRCQYYKKI